MGSIRLDPEGAVSSPSGADDRSSQGEGSEPDRGDGGLMMASVSDDGRVISVTQPLADALGVLPEAVLGMPLMELVASDEREALRAMISKAANAGRPEVSDFHPSSAKAQPRLRLRIERMHGDEPLAVVTAETTSKPMGLALPLTTYEVAEELMRWSDLLAIALDLDGMVITASASVETLTGKAREDIIGRHVSEITVPEPGRPDIIDLTLSRAKSGEPSSGEVRLLSASRGSVRLKWRMQPIRDSLGNVIGTMGFGHELTNPSIADARAREQDQNLEVLAETTTDIVEADDMVQAIEKDLDKLIDSLGVDFAVFRLVGKESKPRMVCAGLDFRRGRMLLESHLVGEGPLYRGVQAGTSFISMGVQSDPRIVLEDKEIKSLICLPIRFRGDVYGCGAFGTMDTSVNLQSKLAILQVFCNQLAISMHKVRLKDELALKNMELESLYETSMAVSSSLEMQQVLDSILGKASELVKADAVYLFQIDKNTTNLHLISSVSPYANVLGGLTIRVGEGITGIVAQTREGMLIERADKDSRSLHVPGTPDDPSSLISVPLKMGDELLGVMTLERVPGVPFNENEFRLIQLFSFQAATAIYNAQMFNRLNEQASSQQMYNILLTHDVANYNVPIHGYLEMLAKDPKLDERQRRFVKSCLAQSENISSLIADVRKLSLLRTMESVRSFEPVDLPKVIAEVLESIRQNILYEDTDVHFHPVTGQALVMGDSFIKDVVYNLISNACKHAGDWPIDVVLREHEEGGTSFWRMDVKDQGGGISEDRKSFLFRRFESVDASSASEGHGIGLSVVSSLCERFGGKIWVEDRERVDGIRGSIFSVTFPRVKV
ncbi:MAG: GAF domain-containing protein [Methanomassiliicoccales archaeon]|nr:GAF domain-containing protein [Methanomassiliicoccales archaeon]